MKEVKKMAEDYIDERELELDKLEG